MSKQRKLWIGFIAALMLVQGTGPVYIGSQKANAEESTGANPSLSSFVPPKPLTDLTIDKARYAPGEKVTFTLHLDQSVSWKGNLNIRVYQLDQLIAEGTQPISVSAGGTEAMAVTWTPPEKDFQGYIVKAWIDSRPLDVQTAAVDVSSTWTRYPRYGYSSEFPNETEQQSDEKMKQLSQDYYLNGYQFYDWMWRHDVSVYSKTDADGKPLKDAEGNFITAPIDKDTVYHDLLGRLLYPLTVKQQVAAAQKYGAAAMAYEMNYAARENYEDFGVKPEWGLYNKNATKNEAGVFGIKDQNGFYFSGVKPNPTALYLQDPGNPEWQQYITKQFDRAVNEFGFNGIHLDQWGASDNDYLLDYHGNKRYYSLDYNKLINSTKESLTENNSGKNDLTFNMVGGNSGYSTVTRPDTKTDFDYSEIWQDKDRYRDLQEVVNDTRAKDGGKAMVIAGYINYKQATGVPYDASEATGMPKVTEFASRIGTASGWVGDFGKKDEDQLIFTVNVPKAGKYELTLNYGHGNDGGSPDGRLSVNEQIAAGSILFDHKTGWGNPVAQITAQAELKAGDNKIKLQLNSNDLWLNVASLDVKGEGVDKRYEAVFAEMISCHVDQYSHVYGFETDGDYVKFHVKAAKGGNYPLSFSYAAESRQVSRTLYVNGKKNGRLDFTATGAADAFEEGQTAMVHLNKGDNVITLKVEGSNDTGLNLQYLKLSQEIYMAQYAETGWSPAKKAEIKAIDTYLGNFTQKGDYIEFKAPEPAKAGEYPLVVTYRNTGTEAKQSVYVNGRKAGVLTYKSTDKAWSTVSLPLYLQSGGDAPTIMLKNDMSSSSGGLEIDKLELDNKTYQAEDASKVTIGWQPVVAKTGSVNVTLAKTDNFGKQGQSIEFDIDTDQAVDKLGFVYRSGNNPIFSIAVDGRTVAEHVAFASTSGGWDGAMGELDVSTAVPAGSHKVKLTLESDGQYINLSSLNLGSDVYTVDKASVSEGIQTSVGYVHDFKDEGDFVTFDVNVPAAGTYDLGWQYKTEGSLVLPAVRAVVINGEAAGAVTFDSTGPVWKNKKQPGVQLQAGNNRITIKVDDREDEGIQLDSLQVASADLSYHRIYEAENGEILPAMILNKDTVENFGHAGDEVSFDVEVPESGETSLIYTYANPGTATTRSLYIDGKRAQNLNGDPATVSFDGTEGLNKYSEDGYFIVPYLEKGKHKITLKMEQDDEKGVLHLRRLTLGYFNEPSVRLMDAALASMGATHIELGTAEKLEEGPNMLAHEYYPNRSKKLLDETKEHLKEYYKFLAAYENLLFDSKADDQTKIAVAGSKGQSIALSTDGSKNSLWYTVRKNKDNKGFESYEVLHLINLLGNDDNWRNAAKEAAVQKNLEITYPVGVTKQEAAGLKVYAATPDSGEGALTELHYRWSGDSIVIELPELEYWSMIVINRSPKQTSAQPFFENNGK
ncbi:glycoside hydrolase family 66 protein [Paenibacillus caui]|uniref:glycoside hydrolase family 66 protein n=1 Tax=Paenibacillus caui TaxID=2873927 RepID=UPI001CA8DAC8|nr:glycoside hydrolase family 66 protein [Paenibacillus caui]